MDADKILKDYVWRKVQLRWWQKLLCRCRYDLEVNWSYVDRKDELIRFTLRKPEDSQHEKVTHGVTRDMCLFRTQFTNNTGSDQHYVFKTQRETSSSCSISVQKGYQIGGKLDVKLSIPLVDQVTKTTNIEPCDVTGGLSGQFTLTKTQGESFNEKLSWSVDTQVKVDSETETTAELVVKEKTLEVDYAIKTTIQPIKEGISVYIRQKWSGDVVTKLEIPQDKFAQIFFGKGIFNADPKVNPRLVTCVTRGSMRAVYGAEQAIRITHRKLKPKSLPQSALRGGYSQPTDDNDSSNGDPIEITDVAVEPTQPIEEPDSDDEDTNGISKADDTAQVADTCPQTLLPETQLNEIPQEPAEEAPLVAIHEQ